MKILIVKLSAFGDIIHCLPALDDLLARPEVESVHWLVDRRYGFVTEVFPEKVSVHDVDLRGRHPLHSAWQATRRLRLEGFDAIIDLQGLIKSGVIARGIGKPVYGFDASQLPETPNRLFITPVRFHADEKHVVQVYRRIATAPFAADVRSVPAQAIPYTPPRIQVTASMEQKGQSILDELGLARQGFVVLHVGGGYYTKRLPDQTWRQVAQGIVAHDLAPLIIWGNPDEQQRAQAIADGIPRCVLSPRRLDMIELCGVLRFARIYFGADTGVTHMAAALGAATVSVWGPTAPWRMGPWGNRQHHVVSHPPCGPCFSRSCRDFICMDRIQAEDLLEVLHER